MTQPSTLAILSLYKQHIGITAIKIAYEVVDIQTKAVIKQYGEGKGQAARNFANKKDLTYGAVRYVVRLV